MGVVLVGASQTFPFPSGSKNLKAQISWKHFQKLKKIKDVIKLALGRKIKKYFFALVGKENWANVILDILESQKCWLESKYSKKKLSGGVLRGISPQN